MFSFPTSIGENLCHGLQRLCLTHHSFGCRELDFDDRPVQPTGHHIARVADITLAAADDFTFDFDDAGYGLDLGPADGIGSGDFDLDLGLSFGDNDEVSVEQGRDAVSSRFSVDSNILGDLDGRKDLDLLSQMSRGPSEHPFATDVDMDLGGDFDLGISFDNPLGRDPTPGRISQSRACTGRLPLLIDPLLTSL
jgi:cohesin complex subunit SCC1